jgi:hypothetical protein
VSSRLSKALHHADNPEFKRRVIASGVLLVTAKMLNVSVPVIMKVPAISLLDFMELGTPGANPMFPDA